MSNTAELMTKQEAMEFARSLHLQFYLYFDGRWLQEGFDGHTEHVFTSEVKMWEALVDKSLELSVAGDCEHGVEYRSKQCIECWGDGTEEIAECKTCSERSRRSYTHLADWMTPKVSTWHRGGKCFKCEQVPEPYSELRRENETLKKQLQLASNALNALGEQVTSMWRRMERILDFYSNLKNYPDWQATQRLHNGVKYPILEDSGYRARGFLYEERIKRG